MIHATRKSLGELGDKVSDAEKKEVEEAIGELEQAMKGDDKTAIESKTQRLGELSGKLAQRLYQQQGEQEGGAAGGEQEGGAAGGEQQEDVVDAEFEEVKDQNKK